MNLRNRHVRVVAAVGAVLAAGTTTFMALAAGTASADEPGRCTQNVNVREDPDPHSKIVALCEADKKVQLGEERDGFVRLDELGGWASKDYVKADEDAASSDANDSNDSAADADGHSTDDPSDHADSDGDHSSADGDHSSTEGDRTSAGSGHGDDNSDNGDNAGGTMRSGAGQPSGATIHPGGLGRGGLGGLLG